VLSSPQSATQRDRLLQEIATLHQTDSAAEWAQKVLSVKNRLTAEDAKVVETAFTDKLTEFNPEVTAVITDQSASVLQPSLTFPEALKVSAFLASGKTTNCDARGGSSVSSSTAADLLSSEKTSLLFPEPRRVRDKSHLRFIKKQACLICGRLPSDAHHLRFAQTRALGRKVSDEFTVPLCRAHHRELHRHSDELQWWERTGVNPAVAARALWLETHPTAAKTIRTPGKP
jgi:hypothetical protein